MAPTRKDKNKMIDAAECSNKRRRTNVSQSSSDNLFGRIFGTDLQFSPPSPLQEETADLQYDPPSPIQQEETEVDNIISWMIPQQNFLINYHMNLMQRSMEEFWKRNLAEKINKRKEIETRLNEREQQADRFRHLYYYYEKRAFELEQQAEQRVAEARYNAMRVVAREEEVESCLVDLNSVQRTDVNCKNCQTQPATMLWLPCRHLCVCLVCERRVKACPICSVKKTESFKIDLP